MLYVVAHTNCFSHHSPRCLISLPPCLPSMNPCCHQSSRQHDRGTGRRGRRGVSWRRIRSTRFGYRSRGVPGSGPSARGRSPLQSRPVGNWCREFFFAPDIASFNRHRLLPQQRLENIPCILYIYGSASCTLIRNQIWQYQSRELKNGRRVPLRSDHK